MKFIAQTPTRIGLIGGGTDVDPFAANYGGKVISLAISLRHNVILVPRKDRQVLVENLGEIRQFELDCKLPQYGEDKNFDLVYAIINRLRSKIPSGFNLYDRFEGRNSSGLGSSGSAAVAIIGVFNHWLDLKLNKKEISFLAWEIETKELGWIQGKQDQLTATYGGINLFSFGPGKGFSVKPIKLSPKRKLELNNRIIMFFTGGSRHSSLLQKKLQEGMSQEEKIKALLSIKKSVNKAVSSLEKGDWEKLGELLDEAWENKKKSNPAVTSERIDYLYNLAKGQGVLGGKIMGAGGEGHMFFICSPKKKAGVIKALASEGAKEVKFEIDEQGLKTKKIDLKTNYHPVVIREGFKPQKRWAVFIDRDGTINREVHLLHKIEDFELFPGTVEAIKRLNQAEIPVFIYHNASVVARGLCDEDQVQRIHRHMIRELEKEGAFVDAVFYCPHHPTAFNLEYISDCLWRKPDSGMIRAGAEMFDLNLKKSYVVGDNARDILMGQKEKTFSILVKTGHGGRDTLYEAKPDHTAIDILAAVKFILKKENL